MTEADKTTADNPFDPEGHSHGGGLWDGKTVTVTSSKAETVTFEDKEKGPQTRTVWTITGIADDEDKERYEQYSAGAKLRPTADGEGFVSVDGGPPKFHANSNLSKFTAALKAAGFDLGLLYPGGKSKLSALTGARFIFGAVPKLDRDGKISKDTRGYTKNAFYPSKFVGWAAGMQKGTTTKAGNGALDAKAEAAVLVALAGGPLSRADLVRKLSTDIKDTAERNSIIGLVVRDDWHRGKSWKYDGTTASL